MDRLNSQVCGKQSGCQNTLCPEAHFEPRTQQSVLDKQREKGDVFTLRGWREGVVWLMCWFHAAAALSSRESSYLIQHCCHSVRSLFWRPADQSQFQQGRVSPAGLSRLCSTLLLRVTALFSSLSVTLFFNKGKFPQPECYSSALLLLDSALLWQKLLHLCSHAAQVRESCYFHKHHSRDLLNRKKPRERLSLLGWRKGSPKLNSCRTYIGFLMSGAFQDRDFQGRDL